MSGSSTSSASAGLAPTVASARRRRAAVAAAAAILLLALTETVSALVAPLRAPSESDWKAAAETVRAGFRRGDLIVAAPAWSDPVMRLHVGDLLPLEAVARLDAGRFPRVWEIAQRGAIAPEGGGAAEARLVDQREQGALTVRLYERPAAAVTFDFTAAWEAARVARAEPGRGEAACVRGAKGHDCPGRPDNFVRPRLVEVEHVIHRGLLVPAAEGATVAIAYDDVPLGRELAVGAGLHSVWIRRHGGGSATLRVLVNGQEIGRLQAHNRSGWQVQRLDTSRWADQRAAVRFEISADRALNRWVGFAAEARGR